MYKVIKLPDHKRTEIRKCSISHRHLSISVHWNGTWEVTRPHLATRRTPEKTKHWVQLTHISQIELQTHIQWILINFKIINKHINCSDLPQTSCIHTSSIRPSEIGWSNGNICFFFYSHSLMWIGDANWSRKNTEGEIKDAASSLALICFL